MDNPPLHGHRRGLFTATDEDFDELTRRGGVPVGSRHTDLNQVEVIPTPGYSPGSTCYQVPGDEGNYLFTRGTVIRNPEGGWWAGYFEGFHT